MKLKVLDQIHVSAVQADALRPRQEIDVSDELGNELLTKHPSKFERLGNKKKPAPQNKAEGAAPANKAARKGKGE